VTFVLIFLDDFHCACSMDICAIYFLVQVCRVEFYAFIFEYDYHGFS